MNVTTYRTLYRALRTAYTAKRPHITEEQFDGHVTRIVDRGTSRTPEQFCRVAAEQVANALCERHAVISEQSMDEGSYFSAQQSYNYDKPNRFFAQLRAEFGELKFLAPRTSVML